MGERDIYGGESNCGNYWTELDIRICAPHGGRHMTSGERGILHLIRENYIGDS